MFFKSRPDVTQSRFTLYPPARKAGLKPWRSLSASVLQPPALYRSVLTWTVVSQVESKQGASRVQVASKPHQGLHAVNETREDATREVSTARGLGLHKTNLACAGEEQDLSGWCGAHTAPQHSLTTSSEVWRVMGLAPHGLEG